MPEIERCWLCHKICERPWNPPDIAPDDMCQCNEPEQGPPLAERIDEIAESIEQLKEIAREPRHAGN
jgi:hypothetical protein